MHKVLFYYFLASLAAILIQTPAFPQEDIKAGILYEINMLRKTGCKCGDKYMGPTGIVKWNDQIEKAAVKHVKDMFSNNHFSHQGTDGSTLSERIDATGYNWSALGENIAFGQSSAADVVEGWQQSPGHCLNMMDPKFIEIGAAKKGKYWVLDLGRKE